MKFLNGPLTGAMSGSTGGSTFSRNKGGQYVRTRAIPTNPSTPRQLQTRGFLATLSQQWQSESQADQDAWTEFARQNPRTDALGQQFLLSGHQAFISLNARILQDAGVIILIPPVTPAPPAFRTLSSIVDVTTPANTTLVFTDPLVSGNKILLFAAVTNSQGKNYVENLYRLITFSAVDQVSPWPELVDLEAVLGTISVGQKVFVKAAQYNPLTGQRSPFLTDSTIAV